MQGQEPVDSPSASAAKVAETARLLSQRNNGASWFYGIAAFSIINLLVLVAGGGVSFLIGLGMTQLVDVLCLMLSEQLDPVTALVVRISGGTVTVGIAGLFVLFGAFARRGRLWAFAVGMGLYTSDGLIFVWLQDWLSLGFHAFTLLMLVGGLQGQLQLNRLEQSVPKLPNGDAADGGSP